MQNVYSVGQVNAYIKNMFAQDFMLNRIYVKGEISNCKYHTSGHIYFSLKDESGMIACILFAGNRRNLTFQMANGQQVIVLGNVAVYERDGTYQLYARSVILDGVGLLYERFEALKQELGEMGMFAEEYKQPIPRFARRIGVVTASTGAAIRDIMNISARRNPYVQLILYPALVQGDAAPESIVKGIEMLDRQGVDVIIVGRGGGSIEELWAFNEEIVARAIFNCNTPIISAVGHETDTTIADYVADLRAPTPSAAAELAVFEYQALVQYMEEQKLQMQRALTRKVQMERMKVERCTLKMRYLYPYNRLRERQQLCVELEEQMRRMMQQKLQEKRQELAVRIERMRALSPLEKLNQGFSYVASEDGRVVKSVKRVEPDDLLVIYMTDGVVKAKAEEIIEEENAWKSRP